MNREIKFRAWDKNGERMIYEPYYFDCPANTYRAFEAWYDLEDGKGFDAIIMQFTGLKDKNGKEIYEGDIVKGIWWCTYVYTGVIKFGVTNDKDNDFYGWYIEYIEHNGWPMCSSIHDINTNFEVIGNIHQNPELIPTKD